MEQIMALLVLPLIGKLRNELSFEYNILRRLPGEEYTLICVCCDKGASWLDDVRIVFHIFGWTE